MPEISYQLHYVDRKYENCIASRYWCSAFLLSSTYNGMLEYVKSVLNVVRVAIILLYVYGGEKEEKCTVFYSLETKMAGELKILPIQ